MKEEWHADSFENTCLSSKNLADFNFHYFTAIRQQTKQVPFPSISGPSPLYLGAGAFLCLSRNRLFTPLAKKARDQLRGFKEQGFCLLLLCYITQGMLIFIRAFMSQLVMAHVTALPTPVSPQSDLSNIFFLTVHLHWPSWFIICSKNSGAIQGRQGKERKESQSLYHRQPNCKQQTNLSTALKAIPLGSAKIHGVIFWIQVLMAGMLLQWF